MESTGIQEDMDGRNTTRSYLVELVSETDPMHCQPVKVVSARSAAEALDAIVGNCRLVSFRWVDTKARDHLVAKVEIDGEASTFRSSRWVS